ncbi:MFS transporter [Microbispora catharanthi]|uniref:MFS transporter n=1 Tax=Microbispora catharanthi TaxID=1712871 RepID=A0A5N6BYJ7_9ACTN|nr:MFS transporter [Microbispora catharanthi]KAB8185549.1 MFS transporter [Microbispora catharanthi]
MTNSGGCAPSANTLEADPRAPGRAAGRRDHAAGRRDGPAGTAARGRISRAAGFWLLAGTLVAFMAASSTPSPLYVLYQQRWGFSAATLTAVFAVYALALLIALLTVGELSDHVGRRPVLIAALLAEAGAMVAFLTADGVGPLLLARAVQGLATGAATGAISAGLVDLQPGSRRVRQLGALVNSAAPSGGLAAGALGAGLFVRYTTTPTTSVFVLLTAVFVVLAAAMALLPEPVAPRPGRGRDALVSLRPRAGVPRHARSAFTAAAPCLVATWAMGGLYLSLGGSLTAGVLRISDHLVGGLVVAALTAAGAVASVTVRDRAAGRVMAGGSLMLAAGTGLTLAALAAASAPLFFAGAVVAGCGFGSAFLGALRSLATLAGPAERAALFASVYVVSYLAFSVPALVAGLAVSSLGLRATATVYGCGVVVLALLAAVLGLVRERAARPA